jgi:hypothetical protein
MERKKEKDAEDVRARGWLGQKKGKRGWRCPCSWYIKPVSLTTIMQKYPEISRYNALLTYNRYYCSCILNKKLKKSSINQKIPKKVKEYPLFLC